jgi:hypothetical protein
MVLCFSLYHNSEASRTNITIIKGGVMGESNNFGKRIREVIADCFAPLAMTAIRSIIAAPALKLVPPLKLQ